MAGITQNKANIRSTLATFGVAKPEADRIAQSCRTVFFIMSGVVVVAFFASLLLPGGRMTDPAEDPESATAEPA